MYFFSTGKGQSMGYMQWMLDIVSEELHFYLAATPPFLPNLGDALWNTNVYDLDLLIWGALNFLVIQETIKSASGEEILENWSDQNVGAIIQHCAGFSLSFHNI